MRLEAKVRYSKERGPEIIPPFSITRRVDARMGLDGIDQQFRLNMVNVVCRLCVIN